METSGIYSRIEEIYDRLFTYSPNTPPTEIQNNRVKISYGQVSLRQYNIDRDPKRVTMSYSQGVLCNLAKIFAGIVTRTSILLEGPPGSGKTSGVLQVAALLGIPCERVNFCLC